LLARLALVVALTAGMAVGVEAVFVPAASAATGAAAVTWANAHNGQVYGTAAEQPASAHQWSGYCWTFVVDAFGGAAPREETAQAGWNYYAARGMTHTGAPPAGTIAFWSYGTDGHAAVAVGGGLTVGTHGSSSNRYAVYSVAYNNRGLTYLGWVDPNGGSGTTGGGGSSLVRSIRTSDGHIQLFQISGGVVRQSWYNSGDGKVGGWTQSPALGAQAVGNPAVVSRPGQSVVDVFVRGGDNRVYETWYNWGTGGWGGWIGMGGAISSDPQAVATSDGHDQVFGTGNSLVKQNWFAPGNGAVGGWVTSAGLGAGAIGSPALVVRSGQSVVDAFVRGGDNRVYETWYNWGTGGWGGWIGMGGAISSDPQAVATSDGHDQVFAGATNGVAQNWFSPGNGAIGGWRTI
jgi:hypothetical protein